MCGQMVSFSNHLCNGRGYSNTKCAHGGNCKMGDRREGLSVSLLGPENHRGHLSNVASSSTLCVLGFNRLLSPSVCLSPCLHFLYLCPSFCLSLYVYSLSSLSLSVYLFFSPDLVPICALVLLSTYIPLGQHIPFQPSVRRVDRQWIGNQLRDVLTKTAHLTSSHQSRACL